jgi:hypothetical protein
VIKLENLNLENETTKHLENFIKSKSPKMKPERQNKNPLVEIIGRIGKKFGGRLIVGLGVAVGFLLFFGWLAEEVFEGETKIFDESIRNFFHGFAAPPVTALMKFFSFVGSPLFW